MPQIRISDEVKKEMDGQKLVSCETYESVIERLLLAKNPVYDKEFREWILENMKREHGDLGVMHITDCEMGLQVFCEKSDIILIPHLELKMLKCLMDEGYDFGKEGHSLFGFKIFQTIDGKLR